jgi:hypothetical protein
MKLRRLLTASSLDPEPIAIGWVAPFAWGIDNRRLVLRRSLAAVD